MVNYVITDCNNIVFGCGNTEDEAYEDACFWMNQDYEYEDFDDWKESGDYIMYTATDKSYEEIVNSNSLICIDKKYVVKDNVIMLKEEYDKL